MDNLLHIECMMDKPIREQTLDACRRLLSNLNRDPATADTGCFDRRYWAWKLTDFPEATFQRNAAPLTWYLAQPEVKNKSALIGWIKSALIYTTRIQHRDGSFDQAYPYERSYGATAFLLPDLINTYRALSQHLSENEHALINTCLTRSADFLCKNSEQHDFIANHLAGAALGLALAFQHTHQEKYLHKSASLINAIIQKQSREGWFPEYGGADPGYQTLCMYYLAQMYQIHPTDRLRDALASSLDFLQYFAHPDGTFGGEYGSRRTEIYYPGGIALLAHEFPVAAVLAEKMARAITAGTTVTVADVDINNLAPLLSNTILAMQAPAAQTIPASPPFEAQKLHRFFPSAGICVHANSHYYAVIGASNGGVLKIFDKTENKIRFDDCGLLGVTRRGNVITSQITDPHAEITIDENTFQIRSRMGFVSSASPNPLNYLLLRLANLTVMRIPFFNEWIKKMLVKMLIKKHDFLPIHRTRRIDFGAKKIKVVDQIEKNVSTDINRLQMGMKFSAIHMASARYFSPAQLDPANAIDLDCEILNRTGTLTRSLEIDSRNGKIVHWI